MIREMFDLLLLSTVKHSIFDLLRFFFRFVLFLSEVFTELCAAA